MAQIKCPKCGEVFTIDETAYSAIADQVKNAEFEKELEKRVQERCEVSAKDFQYSLLQSKQRSEAEKAALVQELNEVKSKLKAVEQQVQLQVELALKKEQEQYNALVADLKMRSLEESKNKELVLAQTKREIEENYTKIIREKDEEIGYLKEMKSKASTKMIGESLEQYCLNEFNKYRPTAFPNAYFEKDNQVVDHSKADFIYKDYTEDNIEYISVIFEMKHQSESSSKKKKNADFFAELDKDRNNKKIEYAVLVSTLEPDDDYYNGGIVDVSYRYPKMYVVRPQCFLAIITLLRNAALQNISERRELVSLKNQNADVSALENELAEFKRDFGSNCEKAAAKFNKAIEDIDKSIKNLQNTRDALIASQKQLDVANRKVDDMTMRKLLKNSPSLMSEYKASKKKTEPK